MGWGKKVTGAKPQPEAPRMMVATLVEDNEEALRVTDAADKVLREQPTDAAKAQVEWHQLKSKKGWTDATLLLLLYEFIQNQDGFADLVKFARRR